MRNDNPCYRNISNSTTNKCDRHAETPRNLADVSRSLSEMLFVVADES
ncbi:MAG: hypothetical protein QNJ47_12860 [Nostocaceae cyanobacterium]|nr:hypothetical protein [Nostocaceae cyanobacterium]